MKRWVMEQLLGSMEPDESAERRMIRAVNAAARNNGRRRQGGSKQQQLPLSALRLGGGVRYAKRKNLAVAVGAVATEDGKVL